VTDQDKMGVNMEKYQQEERMLRIADCIWSVAKNWRHLIICMIVFAVVFGGMKYAKDTKEAQASIQNESETTEEADKTAEDVLARIQGLSEADRTDVDMAVRYVDALSARESYAENAALMQLDAYNVDRMVLRYSVQSENNTNQLLQAYGAVLFDDGNVQKIVDASNDTFASRDVTDMVTTVVGAENSVDTSSIELDNSLLTVTVRGLNEDDVRSMTSVVENILQDYTAEAEQLFGEHKMQLISENYCTGRDELIVNTQNTVIDYIYNTNNKLTTLTDTMNDTQAEIVEDYKSVVMNKTHQMTSVQDGQETASDNEEKVSVSFSKKWILLGAIFGCFIVVCLEVLYWMAGGKLNSTEELQYNFEIRSLGVVEKKRKHKVLNFIDHIIYRIQNRNKKILSNEQRIHMIVSRIAMNAQKDKYEKIYLTGTEIENENIIRVATRIKNELENYDISLVIGKNISCDPEAFVEACDVSRIIILEETGVSKYQEIAKEIRACTDQGVEILGSIVIEH
jgi:hypothetical protein